ncbi:MAG: TRAP transporter large permease [Propionibacteriaceae bacterium]|jgi:tripartite ATP-independent transporter DctM subunit|nr:TRAP transporter large permease [Propionibacteriaceae bacterium]
MHYDIIVLSAVILLVFLFLRFPVFVSLLAAALTYFFLTPGVTTSIFAQRFIAGSESPALLAIPLFVFSGVIMNATGLTKRIMNACEMVVGRRWGGLGHVTVMLATIMGGMSGSNLADAAMQSKMLVPEMNKRGFTNAYSSVLTATSAMITPLIPPGIAMIIYGSVANISIGKLFMAGVGPGLLLMVLLMAMNTFVSHRRGYKPTRTEKLTTSQVLPNIGSAAVALALPVIIIGGIRIGVFSPTEAGAVAIAYAFVVGAFYREMKLGDLRDSIVETASTTAGIMLIIAGASAYAWVLTKEKIPQSVTQYFVDNVSNPWVFMLLVNVLLLIVGMLIEGNAAMIVLVPLLAPAAEAYGFDPIHFGMVFIFNMALGALSPPMGTLMFVTCAITKCSLRDFIKEAVPFYILCLTALMLLVFFPQLTVGIVNLIWT